MVTMCQMVMPRGLAHLTHNTLTSWYLWAMCPSARTCVLRG